MTNSQGKAQDRVRRRMRGFEAAGNLLRDRIRGAGEKRGFAVSRMLTHWPEVVGTDIAGACRPVRIAYGREGMGATLTLLVQGAMAPVIQMQLPQIRDKVNACYGYNAIARITVTQTAAEGFAGGFTERQAGFTPAPPQPGPNPEITARAGAAVADVRDNSLREALEALGRNILSGPKRQKGN
ncbi:DUF721 domain-containing protein [Halodurantibacterium flavum]|uniref:DUF721 domain-containing protein n=1 Tax=Halodurantibacterium flavum TaxID=1382802 RepID=A0ABW4S6N9_9RHOB